MTGVERSKTCMDGWNGRTKQTSLISSPRFPCWRIAKRAVDARRGLYLEAARELYRNSAEWNERRHWRLAVQGRSAQIADPLCRYPLIAYRREYRAKLLSQLHRAFRNWCSVKHSALRVRPRSRIALEDLVTGRARDIELPAKARNCLPVEQSEPLV